ncbi:MAG: prepilin-type N-terminal cleavage/methylation domain-containing protein [Alphaproteobacteria bacterium]|nr:MAG: prepilin-type N-terminal cleavage/methylation domain-containing protein [Alphaproteobacteria bacterium]
MNNHMPFCRHNSGFTLLEMLLVLGIIALLTAMIVPSLSLPAKPPVPAMVAFLQQQQNAALNEGKTRFIYWQAPNIVAEPGGQTLTLDKDIILEINRPAPTGYLGKQLLAIFYSDGTGIASEFRVVQKKTGYPTAILYKIQINPFHSEIAYAFP